MTTLEIDRSALNPDDLVRGGNGTAPHSPPTAKQEKTKRQMLDLPKPGNILAQQWAIVGGAVYAVLAGVLVGSLQSTESLATIIGLGDSPNWMVFLLVISGFCLTVAGFCIVFRDLRRIAREEIDIHWVATKGRPGLPYVFTDPVLREGVYRSGTYPRHHGSRVETLTGDRVSRTQAALADGGMSSASVLELRAIAEKRTSQYVERPRYFSSLLLLLAVLGTFAGVKTALPALIQAMEPGSVQANPHQLSAPLKGVSDAFGGNALALVGAIALGLSAQGLAFGRRNLLERLELVSLEYIYGNEVAGGSDPLQVAAQELKSVAREFTVLSSSMGGVEEGLRQLNGQFTESFDKLTDELRAIVDHQDESLNLQTGQSIDALRRNMTELVQAVQMNAQVTARLFDTVQDRGEAARLSVNALNTSHDQMTSALQQYASAHTTAQVLFKRAEDQFKTMEQAAIRLADGAETIGPEVQQLTQSVRSTGATHERVVDMLNRMEGATNDAQERGWKQLDALRQMLKDHMNEMHHLVARAMETWKPVGGRDSLMMQQVPIMPAPTLVLPEERRESRDRIDEMIPILHEISRQLSQFDELKRAQQRSAWIITGAVVGTGLVSMAGIYLLPWLW